MNTNKKVLLTVIIASFISGQLVLINELVIFVSFGQQYVTSGERDISWKNSIARYEDTSYPCYVTGHFFLTVLRFDSILPNFGNTK
ncbi:MAG: hypothetical protein ACXADA_24370 [Candidatus Hodarchaeales archaeon]